ncbi:MFS transporter [Nocardia brasiliensis]|uniref:MFS transporter n=1 Tax=Nocardia brasiliensis TaxID=37326 RepID=UPI00379B8ED6
MSYRRLATREVLTWSMVSLAGKLPIAMAPLGLVFLVRSTPGGYALGAVLSAGYVLGEVIGAAVQGMWLRQHRIRPQLAAGFAVGAAAFAGLASSGSAPAPLLIGLAFLAGFGPAGSPGGMRSMLIGLVASPDAARALGVEAMLTQVIWAAAPALVVSLATGLFPAAPLTLAAIGAAAAAVLIFLLPGQAAATVEQAEGGWRAVLSGWPIYLTSAAAMSLLATAELVLPALLEFRGIEVRWAGPMLTAFAVTGAVGAFCYGLREWPGTVRMQALVLLVVTAGCVALVAITPGLGIALALAAAGLFQAAVIVARNLALRAQLPAHLHAAAYSVMYAVGGIGYGLAATVSALVLAHTAPSSAILGGVVITLVLTAVSALAERFSASSAQEQSAPVQTTS